MAGFRNDTMFANNVDFTGSISVSPQVTSNGQLLIGSTVAPNIRVGSLTSTAGTITITVGAGTINLDLAGGTTAIDSIGVQTGTNPIVPTAAGLVTINGATAAAGTNPVRTDGTGANTMAVEVQISQALAATDATKIGLCNFDSSRFTVDANGFVSLNASGAGETITGDSGGALSPTVGNWNILGLSGSKTSGAASTLTIKSPPFSQVGASTTSSLNSGEFVTAAVTRTLPVSAGLADGDLFIYSCTTAGALVIQSVGAQKIRIGTLLSSAAGTATSTAIGDSVTLRFDATQGFFMAVSVIGTWLIA